MWARVMKGTMTKYLLGPGPRDSQTAMHTSTESETPSHQPEPAGNAAHDRPDAARSHESGITLIEMMVVLVIIAVVAALIVPNVIGRPDEARATVAATDIRTISSALEVYRLDNGAYPTTEQGLMALVKKPTTRPEPANWHGEGYLPQLPVDPWGNPYVYQSPAADSPFEVKSLGADAKPGGEGAAADLSNRNTPK